jgi:hypothetical protein
MTAIVFNGGSSDRLLSPTQAAYLAGFIDGEGCLTIGRAKKVESRAGFTYFAIVTIGNTNLDALHAILRICGNGKIQLSDKRKALGHKPMYRILFGANQIRWLLPQIRQYLLIKGQQADILASFLAAKVNGRNVSDSDWQRLEDWRGQIRALNKRGIHDVAPDALTVRRDRRVGVQAWRDVRACQTTGCERKHYAKDYCWIHYRKFILRGGPKTYAKQCVVCSGEFVTKRSDTECCSRKCIDKRYYAANAERIKAQVKAAKEKRKAAVTS